MVIEQKSLFLGIQSDQNYSAVFVELDNLLIFKEPRCHFWLCF